MSSSAASDPGAAVGQRAGRGWWLFGTFEPDCAGWGSLRRWPSQVCHQPHLGGLFTPGVCANAQDEQRPRPLHPRSDTVSMIGLRRLALALFISACAGCSTARLELIAVEPVSALPPLRTPWARNPVPPDFGIRIRSDRSLQEIDASLRANACREPAWTLQQVPPAVGASGTFDGRGIEVHSGDQTLSTASGHWDYWLPMHRETAPRHHEGVHGELELIAVPLDQVIVDDDVCVYSICINMFRAPRISNNVVIPRETIRAFLAGLPTPAPPPPHNSPPPQLPSATRPAPHPAPSR